MANVNRFTTESGLNDALSKIENKISAFPITEDIVTITQDATKGVAPYSTSYGMTYIEVAKDSGVEWVNGGLYAFAIDTKLVVASAYRNVAIRIGGADDGDVWHPIMGSSSSILSGYSYFVKAATYVFQYKKTYRTEGALHILTDSNTTYSYLTNTIVCDSTDAPFKIDSNGYGARYSLLFATTPLSNDDGLVVDERYSSLVASSGSGTTKAVVTPTSGKFYIDRHPLYLYSANVAAGAKPTSSLYQDYNGLDLRYTANATSTNITARKKVFLWLKDFDMSDMSFKSDASTNVIVSYDKISTVFPEETTGDVYFYFLGWNTATWYSLTPAFTEDERIYRYTPSTGEMITITETLNSSIEALQTGKQDKLTAGDNVEIDDDGIISASGGGIERVYPQTLNELLALDGYYDCPEFSAYIKTSEDAGFNMYISGLIYVHQEYDYTYPGMFVYVNDYTSGYTYKFFRGDFFGKETLVDGVENEISTLKEDLAAKMTEPTSGLAVGKYFKVASIDSDGHAVLEACDLPIATNSQLGTIKTTAYGGLFVNSNGQAMIYSASNSEIDTCRTNSSFRKAIVPYNLDYAVKSAMCDGVGAAWSATEQAAARARLGVDKEWVLKATITNTGDTSVDLSNCTELFIVGKATNTASDILYYNGNKSLFADSFINGTRAIWALFTDLNGCVFPVSAKCGNNENYGNITGSAYVRANEKISNMISFRIPGTATNIEYKIYAR